MPSSPLIVLIIFLQVIAIVKPVAAQNCNGCTPPAITSSFLPSNAVPVNTTIITGNTSPITGCTTMTFVCPEGSLVQIFDDGSFFEYDLMVHTFECGPSGYGFLYEDYDYYADEFSEQYLYEFDFSFIQCYTIPCTSPICPLSLIQFNVGNPNLCDQSLVVSNTFTDPYSGCIDIAVYCQHPSFTLYEVFANGTVQALNATNNYDYLGCQSSPTSGFYSYFTNNNPLVSQVYCSNPNTPTNCSLVPVPAPAACAAQVPCTLPVTNVALVNLSSNAVPVSTNITNGTSPITGCATVTFVCSEGSLVQINYNGNEYILLQYDLIEHTLECGSSGFFGFVDYNYDVDNPLTVQTITNISSIQCYTLSCNQSICPLSLIQFDVGNPNPCDQSLVLRNTGIFSSVGCISILVYCQHPSFTLYEVLVNGTVQALNASNNYDQLYSNAPTNCSLVSAPAACSAPVSCYQCGNSCAVLNYPNTNIALQINPQFTFNGQPYTSTIYANGLAECGNRLFTTEYPTTSNTSVNATLKSGQFIGVFTCPFAMCVCTDASNGTLDCYRGNSSVQILLVPVVTASPNSKAVILGIVLQSIISSPFGSWSPPSNLNNLPTLTKNNYVKINHLACVSGLSASCPIAA